MTEPVAAAAELSVLDALVAVGTPYDVTEPDWGRHPLRLAAGNSRVESVRRLLALGAAPAGTDEEGRSALDLCRAGRTTHPDDPGFDDVERLLEEAR